MTPEREGRATRTPQWEAGRALDAEIAETVMGEVAANAPVGDGMTRTATIYKPTMQKANEEIRRAYPKSLAKGQLWDAQYVGPRYSTDMAAAWSVVENLASRGWKVDVQNRYAPTWACHVSFPAPDYRNVFTHTNSAALSICLAALEAIGAIPLGTNSFPRSAALPATPQDHTRPLRTE